MKIAITGVHSSGKTTLAKRCSEYFGLKYVRGDTIRTIMGRYFPDKSYDNLTKEEYWKLENIGLSERMKAEKKEESFISDGCTLNSIAYAKAKLEKDIHMIKDFDKFSRVATDNAKHYDFIFYLPPEIPLVDDGFRPLDKEFRLLVNRILLQNLKYYTFYTISGSIEDRLRQIEKIIRNNTSTLSA